MNIVFEYLYRDGANYKNWGQVIVAGSPEQTIDELEQRIRQNLIDGEFFVAEDIPLPTLYFSSGDVDLDHGWHEYSSLASTECSPTTSVSIEEIITRLAHSLCKIAI